MARLNIEDSLWSDQRFLRFCIKVQDEVKAVGYLVMAWRLAQKHWCPERRPIPRAEWEANGLPWSLAESGLAEITEEGVYLKGCEAAFAWWFQKQKAGQRSADARAKKPKEEGVKPVERESTGVERTLTSDERPSTSSSSSFSLSNTNTEESIGETAVAVGLARGGAPAKKPRFSDDHKAKAKAFVAKYVEAYQTRFPNGRPEDLNDSKTRGQIMAWVRDYPLERACYLIQVYFQLETKWFATKGYDFITFKNNLNKIAQALDSGADPDDKSVNWDAVFGGAA